MTLKKTTMMMMRKKMMLILRNLEQEVEEQQVPEAVGVLEEQERQQLRGAIGGVVTHNLPVVLVVLDALRNYRLQKVLERLLQERLKNDP